MDPALLCKIFFSIGTAVDIGGTLIPSFRTQIMNYGSRNAHSQSSGPQNISRASTRNLSDYIAAIQVPHTWFTHYYIISVASSIFWAFQIYTRGAVFRYFALNATGESHMTANQVVLAWSLMAVQGIRRLYESVVLMKPSQAKMWVGLWLIGILYYAFMGIAVWIEGIGVLSQPGPLANLLRFTTMPSTKTAISIPIFLVASSIQHICHKHLASLKKYTLPYQYFFQFIVCPHYTSECFIYLAIAIIAAPKDQWLNRTVLAGMTFVVSNLSVTADATRKWSVEKFGADKLAKRWRMFPYVY